MHALQCAESICRGVYPWEAGASNFGAVGPTVEELLTQLRNDTCRMARCEEELKVLREEQERCMAYLRKQQAAIQDAIVRIEQRQAALGGGGEVPPCSSAFSSQPASPVDVVEEQAYCDGLLLLLRGRLHTVASRFDAACCAFGTGAVAAAPAADEYDSSEEGGAM